NFEGAEIIAHETDFRKRKVKEAMAMISQKHTFSKPNATINPIWHPLIRAHGEEYFKTKATLPPKIQKVVKTPRAINLLATAAAPGPFNNNTPTGANARGGQAMTMPITAATPSRTHTYNLRTRK
ncbi:MAG: hypothetical protein ACRDCT_14985, partial [Shewanella sp.]